MALAAPTGAGATGTVAPPVEPAVAVPGGPSATAPGEPDAAVPATRLPLRVVVAGTVPFVTRSADDRVDGLSVELWTEVADSLQREFQLTEERQVDKALRAVASGQADVAVGPISITAERAKRIRFTQPYYRSSLAILAPASGSLLAPLKPFLTQTFLAGTAALLLVLIGVGAAIWMFERRGNPEHFPERPLPGIGNGVWMALVTMTTVGYGDRVPRTAGGRVVTGVWMLVSMIVASSLTAFMATALTLSQLDGPKLSRATDLKGRKVAVVAGTTSERFVTSYGGRVLRADDLDAAVALVAEQRAAAVVADRPMLRYWLSQNEQSPLQLTEASYEPQGYGFAVAPSAAQLQSEIDVALLQLSASGRIAELAQERLGPE